METLTFHNAEMFGLLLVLPFMIHQFKKSKTKNKEARIKLPTIDAAMIGDRFNPKTILFLSRLMTVLLLVVALARPVQTKHLTEMLPEKQLAIVLAVDVSKSMLAEDLKPNRLIALKTIASDFIDKRPKDLIGLTIYAGESFTQCPLTTDHALVKSLLADASNEGLADGTAIGMGLASAVSRLKKSSAEAKVIVLLTDGENNAGVIDPIKAAALARKFKIKVYTIGIGTEGMAPFPIPDVYGNKMLQHVPVSIDEALLRNIAQATNGNYFRAKSNKDLEIIYKKINALETSEPQAKHYLSYEEWYLPLVAAALMLLLTEVMLRYTLLKSFI